MPSKSTEEKNELLTQVNAAGRLFSDATLRFHELVAQKAGLNSSDHKYLGIIMQHPSLTAGELAAIAGLTSGSVTGLIDRLEHQQLVSRQKDPLDRRKVVIVANAETVAKLLGPVFQRLEDRLTQVNATFDTAALATILQYMSRTSTAMQELNAELMKD